MSRAVPPFQTSNGDYRRAKSPTNGLPTNPYNNSSGQSTPPLSINRPSQRPTTPNSVAGSSKAFTSPLRPSRSDLRARQGSGEPVRSRLDYNIDTTPKRPRYERDGNNGAPSDDTGLSPTSPQMSAVAAAFQSAGAARRAMMNGDTDRAQEREREMAREKERQRRLRDKVQGRRTNGKAKAGDIDAVLDQISDEWEAVLDPEFNPVDLALSLMDDSSLGKDMTSFQETKRLLEKTLRGTVNKHYQSFAAALPRHASLLNSLTSTQTQIGDMRTSLQEVKEALGSKRADLVQLWTRGQTLEEMLRLLDQIEYLKAIPDTLESLMSEKRLLQASVLLVRSLKTIGRPDMLEIGAVADLRSYLSGQETALKEILIEELHAHLYLKTFWCESRWSPYSPGQQTIPTVEYEKNGAANEPPKAPSLELYSRPQRLIRFIHSLMIRPNQHPVNVSEDPIAMRRQSTGAPVTISTDSSSGNPESDSFSYIETVLESLAVLGELGNALDVVAQRLPVEIYSLVETTIEEVNERAEFNKRMLSLAPGTSSMGRPSNLMGGSRNLTITLTGLRLTSLESSVKPADQEILRDMFWTLYSKLDAVLQSLRVVYEVANRIGSRRDFKDSAGAKPGAIFPLAELWHPIQAEIRSLLHDYLTDEERGVSSGRNSIKSISEVLREGRITRDKTKPVFRFADSDSKLATRSLKQHEDELIRVLKQSVPGLVQGTGEQAAQSTLTQIGTDERFLEVGRHRVLVRPDAFHVGVLFQPTLSFLDRVVEILPTGVDAARASSAFLDEFVLNVYLPQLEEKVQSIFTHAVSDPDAFQPDAISTALSAQPLVKASTQLTGLTSSLCAMLRTTPFHRENYSRLILGVIIQFYHRCSDYFRELVSRPGSNNITDEMQISTSAVWAQRPEITACLSALYSDMVEDPKKRQNLCRQEARVELGLLGNDTIPYDDLITANRKLEALGNLYHSLSWFIQQLSALKILSEEPVSPGSGDVLEPPTARTPYTPRIPMIPPVLPHEQPRLPLTRAMALRFDALLKTYEQLAEMVLFTFRTDIRCRAIHYLNLSLRRGNYQLEHEPIEPDPHIVELNIEIGKCDDAAVASLPEKERRFVFEGLGTLMEQVLISGSRQLRFVNEHGVKKILRNVVSLQQNLKTLTDGPRNTGLERAKQYYGLYSITPSAMLEGMKKKPQFTFEEYRSMLNFQCGVDQALGEAGAAQATDREYSSYLIQLHELAVGDIMDDDS
ncbi:Sec8 exocyst complex component-specific domain-containing protein [Hysterangium stoloniferum]|nr:Sec8 exocyst complex component-specific domain-containing protein [Hysterangium stoloniferum]